MNLESKVTIFTDGSSRGNPGPGGWAAIIVKANEIIELGGREEYTTNNRMELMAAIKGMEQAGFSTQVFCDSRYVINGITKWVAGWRKKNWVTTQKEQVLNRDLWEKLSEVTDDKVIEWTYIGGHVGIAGNERCDEIATAFADGQNPDLYKGSLEEYPVKNILKIYIDPALQEKKKSTSAHSKAKAYSYVSMVNGVIQTHALWGECEKRVKGAKGAKYKKSLSARDEADIISSWRQK
jgi:ribonuclease HI